MPDVHIANDRSELHSSMISAGLTVIVVGSGYSQDLDRGAAMAAVMLIGLIVGLAGGAALVWFVLKQSATTNAGSADVRKLIDEQRRAAEESRDAAIHAAVQQVHAANKAMLEANRTVSGQELEMKKSLIDKELASMRGEFEKMATTLQTVDTHHTTAFTQIATLLKAQSETVGTLSEETQGLREALSSTKARGHLGEQLAEDVLHRAGFVENVNYRKQKAIEGGGIPDYEFLLPKDMVMYMDVKFPLNNYLHYLNAENDIDKKRCCDDFLRDVRNRIKELQQRSYLENQNNTIDGLLLFIPNDAILSFVQEHDFEIITDAMRNKVVLCSPSSLFMTLQIIRQAVDNFQLERTSAEILLRLHSFENQWERFAEQMDKVQRHLNGAMSDYETLVGTRRNGIERELRKIDELRQRELSLVEDPELEAEAIEDDDSGAIDQLVLEN